VGEVLPDGHAQERRLDGRLSLRRYLPLALAIPGAAIVATLVARQSYQVAPGPHDKDTAPVLTSTAPRRAEVPVGRGWVGLAYTDESGAVTVKTVFAGSPAERAGFHEDDVILSVDGVPATMLSVKEALASARIGATLSFERQSPGAQPDKLPVTVELSSGIGPFLDSMIATGSVGLAALQKRDSLWLHFQADVRTGVTRTGVATSALACAALAGSNPEADTPCKYALEAGIKALLQFRFKGTKDRPADAGLDDPIEEVPHRVYANAMLLMALTSDRAKYAREIAELRNWLVEQQVSERWGFDPLDYRYGGWSYYDDHSTATLRADVSVTSWALDALAMADLPADNPAWARGGRFLARCQNREVYSQDPKNRELETPLRDGGFGFHPRFSKAGSDDVGNELVVFRSYGSATADGVRGLIAASGEIPNDGIDAGMRWLARNYLLEKNPALDHVATPWNRGIHYYWLAVFARALNAGKVNVVVSSPGNEHAWPQELARFLGTRQDDSTGLWSSPNGLMGEDSQVVATSLALLGLEAARERMRAEAAGQGHKLEGGVQPPRPQPVPFPPASGDLVEKGRQLFLNTGRTNCTGCHQDGTKNNGPNLVGVADRYFEWKGTKEAAADYLRHHIREPKDYPGSQPGAYPKEMIPFDKGLLSDEELDSVVEFLLSRTGTKPVSRAK
jgi:mono/diheme cytochrome c family protein